jgi:hypothetical protein
MTMLLLPNNHDPQPAPLGYSDHQDPQLMYYLSEGATVARARDGWPAFVVLRYRDDMAAGGILSLRLVLKQPSPELLASAGAAGRQPLPVVFDEGAFRLRVRSSLDGSDAQAGFWRPAVFAGSDVTVSAVHLDLHETQMLLALLEGGQASVEVDLDLGYRGLVAGMPWLVTAQAVALRAFLAPMLGNDFISADQIVAAFLSIPEQSAWLSRVELASATPVPTHDALMTEIALRSLDRLFEAAPGPTVIDPPHYRMLPPSEGDPPAYSWDLLTYRLEQRRHRIGWSVDELAPQLADANLRQRMFPVAGQFDILGHIDVYVFDHLRYDPAYLRELRVDLRCTGPAGAPIYKNLRFDGTVDLVRFEAIYPAVVSDFKLSYRLTTTLAPPNSASQPITIRRDFVAAERPLIEVTSDAAGIEIVRVEADPRVFQNTPTIDVQVWRSVATSSTGQPANDAARAPYTTLTLTLDRSDAWVALPATLPSSELRVRCLAYAPRDTDRPPYTVLEGTIADRTIRITDGLLEVLQPDVITLTLDPELAPRIAYAAIELLPNSGPVAAASGKQLSLEPNQPQYWYLWRSSIFDPVSFSYRVSYVTYDDAGKTLPLTTTDWMTAEGSALVVRPPLPQAEGVRL